MKYEKSETIEGHEVSLYKPTSESGVRLMVNGKIVRYWDNVFSVNSVKEEFLQVLEDTVFITSRGDGDGIPEFDYELFYDTIADISASEGLRKKYAINEFYSRIHNAGAMEKAGIDAEEAQRIHTELSKKDMVNDNV